MIYTLNLDDIKFDGVYNIDDIKFDGLYPESYADTIVNKPPHYQTKTGLETIDVIDAFTEDLTGMEAVCTANVLKYVCRWKKKNGVEDLKKARWYLNRLISTLEGAES